MHNDGLPNPFSFKYVFIFPILLLSFLPTRDAMRKEWARRADLRGFSSAWASPWAIERQMQKQYISAEVTAWGWYRKDQIPQPSRPNTREDAVMGVSWLAGPDDWDADPETQHWA